MTLAKHLFEDTSALDELCKPRFYNLSYEVSALQFEVMKLIPARYIVEEAIRTGKIRKGTTVVESSSGTFAVALAIVCANHDLPLRLVTGPIPDVIKWRLESLGATVDIIHPTGGEGGIQQDRMNHLQRLMAEIDDIFWTQQHANPMNPRAYEHLMAEHAEQLAGFDYLVCSTGTGGSITGMSRGLRRLNPDLKVIAVDHNLSILFGPTSGEASRLCAENYHPLLGMGSDVVHPNLDHSVCDDVHWVPVNEMIHAAHDLHNRYGIYIGPTGASTYRVARWITQQDRNKRALCIFCDHGVRYVDTVYSPQWLASYGSDMDVDPDRVPARVGSPQEVGRDWAWMTWGRKSYRDALGFDPVPRAAAH